MTEIDVPNQLTLPATDKQSSLPSGFRVYDANALMGPATEIGIAHDGALYRLRVTRAGKLILTK